MTDEVKLKEQVNRGERAKRLIEQDIVQEAFAAVEKTLIDAWKLSSANEERERQNAYLMYRLFQNFKNEFTRAVATGEASRKELLTINDPSRIRRAFRARS